MKIVLLCASLFLLSACTQYKWVKAGKNDAEMNKEYTSCHAKALTDLPPDNKVFNSSSSGYGYEEKRKKGKKEREYENYDEWTRNDINDANSQQREILVRDWMYSRGWDEIVISQ